MRRMGSYFGFSVLVVLLVGGFGLVVAEEERDDAVGLTAEEVVDLFGRDRLMNDGRATMRGSGQYRRVLAEVGPEYWVGAIAEAGPVRVYGHRGHLALVLDVEENEGWETGLYLEWWGSSFAPANGEDGFWFAHIDGYERGIRNGYSVRSFWRMLDEGLGDPNVADLGEEAALAILDQIEPSCSTADEAIALFGAERLWRDGMGTMNCRRSGDRPLSYVPVRCWVGSIGELKPLRVYRHAYHLVVMLDASEEEGWESGLFIESMISSYAPIDGLDGFWYQHVGGRGLRGFFRWVERGDLGSREQRGGCGQEEVDEEQEDEVSVSDRMPEEWVAEFGLDALTRDALLTMRCDDVRGDWPLAEIDSSCWSGSIAEMQPVRVYNHRGHLAVVLDRSESVESGLYFTSMIASYLTVDGEDGFEFEDMGDGILLFTRPVGESVAD